MFLMNILLNLTLISTLIIYINNHTKTVTFIYSQLILKILFSEFLVGVIMLTQMSDLADLRML